MAWSGRNPEYKIADLFTADQLRGAVSLFNRNQSISLVDQLESQVVKPAMKRIDEVTKQENDSRYMAYALYYAITQGSR